MILSEMIRESYKKDKINNMIKIALGICVINIFESLLYNYTLNYFKLNYKANPIAFNSIYEEFFLVVCLAPIFETIIFQFIPVYFLKRFDKIIIILVSSLMFGVSHWYNVMNFIHGLLVGFLFIAGYFYSIGKKLNPILTIICAHSFYNFYAFIMNNFIK
jgi:uncharacterized protein